MNRALGDLARAHGVLTGYTDGFGERRHPDDETLLAVLRSLAVPIDHPDEAPGLLRSHLAERAATVLEPVTVAWDGRFGEGLPLRLPLEAPPVDVTLTAALEGGGETAYVRRYREDDPDVRVLPGGRGARTVLLRPDVVLPPGRHELHVEIGSRRHTTTVVSAPRGCPAHARRTWGVFLPLYALRHGGDWGVGDLSGLAGLLAWLGRLGGDHVATLPLFAAFLAESGPFEPSPYRPVSRLFWNEVFLDPEALPEARSDAVRSLLAAHPVVVEREALRLLSEVDYRRVAHLKRQIVAECAAELGRAPRREHAFREWLAADPTRLDYARFRASCERLGAPAAGAAPGALQDADPEVVRYHAYAQWAMDQQLSAATAGPGSRLALDLPLGVHPEGFDVWQRPGDFAAGVHLGAPPDAFMTEGQDWDLPPLVPSVSRSTGHGYLVACLRTVMRHCGLVRLDHIMGLHRQFFVPEGREPSSGTYVRLPSEELYALVSLEAWRAGTVVVGEDIGTVPRAVRRAMAEHRVLRTYALQAVETPAAAHGFPLPGADSLAMLGTHDMPTFAAFWYDLDLPPGTRDPSAASEHAAERERRSSLRRALRAAVSDGPAPVEAGGDAVDGLAAALSLLAESPAAEVIVNLEDLWLETLPQNVPGSPDPLAHWRRRARVPLEALESEAAAPLLAAFRHRREEAA